MLSAYIYPGSIYLGVKFVLHLLSKTIIQLQWFHKKKNILQTKNSRFHSINNHVFRIRCFLFNQPGINAMTKEELLAKVQASIDEQQAKLEALRILINLNTNSGRTRRPKT